MTTMEPVTVVYKHVDGLDIAMDIYPPLQIDSTKGISHPAVVYFHGGGMTVGDRNTGFPDWLCKRAVDAGIAFITVDYRLIPPSTGHDVLADIRDLFTFLSDSLNTVLASRGDSAPPQIDPSRLAVAGSSAGGLCCYLVAAHAIPKPKAVVSIYGLGGDFLSPHFYTVKNKPFFMGLGLLDPAPFQPFFHPQCMNLAPLAGSPITYQLDNPTMPMPPNPRMALVGLYIQLGVYLDYWTGIHGLSARVRSLLPPEGEPVSDETREAMREAIPEEAKVLFPQFWVSKEWPRTFMVHGDKDTGVHVEDSRRLRQALLKEGVDARLEIVSGEEHMFDYQPGVEERYGKLFDEVGSFLKSVLVDGD